MSKNSRRPTLTIGLVTMDSVNEQYAGDVAARTRDLVIAAPKLDSLLQAEVDAIVYDLDHLRMAGDPVALVLPGAARLQVAFGYSLKSVEVKQLRRRGIIVCRRVQYAIRLVARLLRYSPAAAA